jgi:hypoxanthine phosphoribosyltransferase
MLTDDGKHLYISWNEYHELIERLALKVHTSGWQFDQILCLARGGMRPGDMLSRIFDKPLAIMSTSSYRAEAGTIQGRLDMAKYITLPRGELSGRVLLVDDLADSGVTLAAVAERLCCGPRRSPPTRPTTSSRCCPPARGSTSRSRTTTTSRSRR